jgi:DNA-binding response OmpR family regulator
MTQQKILIFAHDPRLCRLLLREAHASGFEGIATSELGKLEDHFRSAAYDLIFMEVDEPLERLQHSLELMSANPRGRLMLLSGVSGPRLGELMLRATALRVNIAGILYKPMGIDAIRAALRHQAGDTSASNLVNQASQGVNHERDHLSR